MTNDTYTRSLGCMYGLAIGDALGMSVEFMERDTYDWVTDYLPNPHWNLEAGSWTDDTSMALCLAQSLIDEGFNREDQLLKYVDWYLNGYMSVNSKCFDIGNTCKLSLDNFIKTAQTTSPYSGSQYSGNGSLMRLAPVPIYFHKAGVEKIELMSGQSSITTHSSPECVAACQYLGKILYWCINGENRNTFNIPNHILRMKRSDVKSTGYVQDTLFAALWAFYKTHTFEDCVIQAVNLGDDTDTVGAVAGMIAGAYYGSENIPQRFKTGLKDFKRIQEISISLYSKAINI